MKDKIAHNLVVSMPIIILVGLFIFSLINKPKPTNVSKSTFDTTITVNVITPIDSVKIDSVLNKYHK